VSDSLTPKVLTGVIKKSGSLIRKDAVPSARESFTPKKNLGEEKQHGETDSPSITSGIYGGK
jgi:hypothetical protein